jgi:hypothetical protein
MIMDAPKTSRRRWMGLALLLVLPLLTYAAAHYQQSAAREHAAELEAYCAEPATVTFSLKLACVPRRDQ